MTSILFALFFGTTENYAQTLPSASTSESPLWYYIQVKGSDTARENLVFTAEDVEVHGRAMRDDAINPATVSAQLWRFEDVGDGWLAIINKSTGQKIDVAYDVSRSIGYATLTTTPASKFKIIANTGNEGYYTIRSAAPASGGSSSEIYFHQANTGGSRDYIIMLVGTDYGFGDNSAFVFVPYVDSNIEYSTETSEIWYNIVSGKTGIDKCIEDNGSASAYPLLVEAVIDGEQAQQWKVVKDARSGGVYLANRGTGNYIQTQSAVSGIFNLPQLGASASGTRTLTYLGQGQYSIAGVEQDGVTRYLHLSTQEETPEGYVFKNALNSGFSWYFRKVSGGTSDISTPSVTPLKITVTNRRIVVDAENYTLRNINGALLKKDTTLPVGIYLVTAEGATTKVIVI